MKKKLIESMLLVALACVVLTAGFMLPRLYRAFTERALDELKDISVGLASMMENAQEAEAALSRAGTELAHLRISWIDGAGRVLYDSDVSRPEAMENHAERREIAAARETGEGSDSRLSASLGERTYYYARRLSDGSILRLSDTQRSIWAEIASLIPWLVLIALLALGLSVALAGLLTRRMIAPINRLNLDHPESNTVYEELTPLLGRLAQQNRRVKEQLRINHEASRVTAAITENMSEGLLMVSPDGHILSINHSAARLLGDAPEAYLGRHYLLACRDLALHGQIEEALQKERTEGRMALGGRIFRVLTEQIHQEAMLEGILILLLDITEHEQAEATRREFTANVSHELKTPLTTIAGYAEMMRAGLSDAEDTAALSGKILEESKRLLALIEDIIKLSRLDERAEEVAMVPVSLYSLAASVVKRAVPIADERKVTVSLSGGEQTVLGSPTLLEEILLNLVDNAIRYNVAGGTVAVHVGGDDDSVLLQVEDTGAGIAPEHHARVFERFYRVDKSHSRETGGTGLGLSIVKHGVQNHGGTISLESRPGKGTKITITLPRSKAQWNIVSGIFSQP